MEKEDSYKSSRKRDRSRSRSLSPHSKHRTSTSSRRNGRDEDGKDKKNNSKKDKRDRSRERSVEKRKDKSRERGRDRSNDRPSDRSNDRIRDRSSERLRERSRDRKSRYDDDRSRSRRDDNQDSASSSRSSSHRHESTTSSESKTSSSQQASSSFITSYSTEHWAEEREAQKQREDNLLDDEIRKRKERVKVWQEAKRLAQLSSDEVTTSSMHVDHVHADDTTSAPVDDMMVNDDVVHKHDDAIMAEENQDTSMMTKQWSLEDEDSDDDNITANEVKESMVDNLPVSNDHHIIDAEVSVPEHLPQVHTKDDVDINNTAFDGSSVVKSVTKKRKMRFSSAFDDTSSHTGTGSVHASPAATPTISSASTTIISTSTSLSQQNIIKPSHEPTQPISSSSLDADVDPLDAFMTSLYGSGQVEHQKELKRSAPYQPSSKSSTAVDTETEDEDEYSFFTGTGKVNPFGSNFITLDQLQGLDPDRSKHMVAGWESDIGGSSPSHNNPYDDVMDDDERDEKERQEFLEAIRKAQEERDADEHQPIKQVRFAESMIEDESITDNASIIMNNNNNQNELGRIFASDGDVDDEENLEMNRKKNAIDVLEEAKKGKELKPVDHTTISYAPFRKNIYIVPRQLAKLSKDEISKRRDILSIVVRGKECPTPVDNWEQCGLSDRILEVLELNKLHAPFAIQQQAIPAIMCGRDIIGVAKTGSGKTLAFLLPMIRHIQDQPGLKDGDGPIGLIMAPARELALQIRNEAKKFTKYLNMRVACVYGGAAVADQIGDLKRGAEIVVCTPGRMIELLCMQAGKMISLRRVTMIVLDEADRMFDMGFESQIKMIIQNVRPDRQTVLFSATFPKQIEKLAKSFLQYPLEIIIGERSSVNKDITQIIEVHEEEDKYLRLLQILGIWYERGSVLVFVDKQEKCDALFSDLLKSGYPCVSLHGGKDQIDRDYTIHQFKTGVFTLMIATSVAGRGLDVPDIMCVVNYNCPNHLEDYVHRVGRTGRAGRKGTAYTFISSKEEQYAPIMIKVVEKAKISPIPQELIDLNKSFQDKVARGEAHYVGSGFVGKGFKFDATEMNEQQKVVSLQRKQYDMENGLLPDDDGGLADVESDDDADVSDTKSSQPSTTTVTSSSSSATSSSVTVNQPPSVSSTLSSLPSNLTPVERARALVAQISGRGIVANAVTMPAPLSSTTPAVTTSASSDPKAAITKALMLARQLGSGSDSTSNVPDHCADEFEINEYPHQARRKLNLKQVMEDILERTGASITSKGVYIPPGKKPELGERKLYLLIEGDNELIVKQARLEVQRVLDEETLRVGSLGTGATATVGRYSVT